MNKVSRFIRRIIKTDKLIDLPSPGLYHFTQMENGGKSRLHLRIEDDRSGTLLINASRLIHLNPTATLMAYLALNHISSIDAGRLVTQNYKVSRDIAVKDYTQFVNRLAELCRPNGACPIHDLELEVTLPFSTRPSAPYRMDLALTYRCNNDCAHCYNERPRSYSELSTSQWKQILDTIWDHGIPHVVFTGGEPTLRDDLPKLIAHAENNGQITGVNSNGRRFADKNYVHQLVEAGLDHVQITIESHNPNVHNQMVNSDHAWQQTVAGIRNVLDSPLYVMTNTTMLKQNSPQLDLTIDFLAGLGVPTIGLNALIYAGHGLHVGSGLPENELLPLLELARHHTTANQQRLIWYTPTEYCHFDPAELELGIKGCTAAMYNMCVESNGDVIPCQSYYQTVGNILKDDWDLIWNHPLCHHLRERKGAPPRCKACVLFSECGGGCPLPNKTLEPSGGSYDQYS